MFHQAAERAPELYDPFLFGNLGRSGYQRLLDQLDDQQADQVGPGVVGHPGGDERDGPIIDHRGVLPAPAADDDESDPGHQHGPGDRPGGTDQQDAP